MHRLRLRARNRGQMDLSAALSNEHLCASRNYLPTTVWRARPAVVNYFPSRLLNGLNLLTLPEEPARETASSFLCCPIWLALAAVPRTLRIYHACFHGQEGPSSLVGNSSASRLRRGFVRRADDNDDDDATRRRHRRRSSTLAQPFPTRENMCYACLRTVRGALWSGVLLLPLRRPARRRRRRRFSVRSVGGL